MLDTHLLLAVVLGVPGFVFVSEATAVANSIANSHYTNAAPAALAGLAFLALSPAVTLARRGGKAGGRALGRAAGRALGRAGTSALERVKTRWVSDDMGGVRPLKEGVRRARLPPRPLSKRRLQSTEAVEWQGQEWLMSVGSIDREGARGVRQGPRPAAPWMRSWMTLACCCRFCRRRLRTRGWLSGREGVDCFAPAASLLGLASSRRPWSVKSATASRLP